MGGLGFAGKVDTTAPYDDNLVPEELRRLCVKYGIDSDTCVWRKKVVEQKAESARNEMWDPTVFVPVARAVIEALHEDILRGLNEFYLGHRTAGYGLRTRWLELATGPRCARRRLPAL
ncbi:hypothetical protein RhiTH_011274 [Rhizoctonia solani]